MEMGKSTLLGTDLELFDKKLFDWANKMHLQTKKHVVVVLEIAVLNTIGVRTMCLLEDHEITYPVLYLVVKYSF